MEGFDFFPFGKSATREEESGKKVGA